MSVLNKLEKQSVNPVHSELFTYMANESYEAYEIQQELDGQWSTIQDNNALNIDLINQASTLL